MIYSRISNLISEFPRQFWILFGGTLVNSLGSGMIFPFLTLYLHQHLNLSMTLVGVLLTLWSASSLVGQVLGGSFTDRFGRRRLMVFSLAAGVVLLPLFGLADTVPAAAAVAVLLGSTGAMYQPARDAMIADLVGSAKRVQAYGLIRVVSNLGIAIGPAVGGFLAAQSYMLAFLVSAAASAVFCFVQIFFIRETKPLWTEEQKTSTQGSFFSVLGNTPFVVFAAATTLVVIGYIQMMTVLPVYMKDQFGLGEWYYGWVMTTNAGMVVALQFPITRATQRVPRLFLIALGALLYALGVGSVALGSSFEHFIAAMVVTTFGEMITVPTATAITADLAPAEMRGRYMSVLGLTWSLGMGVGPILGGLVSDSIAPRALWPIMASAALAGVVIYLLLAKFVSPRMRQASSPAAD